jgi:exosortase A
VSSKARSNSLGTLGDSAVVTKISTFDEQRQHWQHAIAALGLILSWTLWLYWDTARAMVVIWFRSETFTHAFLVVPIVLWLVWRARDSLFALTPRSTVSSLCAVLVAAFIWLMGDLVAVNAVTQLALVTLLVLAVPAVLGFSIAWRIFFPLMFMYFAVPIGEFFMPQLMEWTADFTVAALRLSGIPVFREGLQFVIPSGNWSVVEACSGIRYLIASMTVGTLFAYLNYQSTQKRVVFFLVSILVPILANWLRAYIIVMLGHLSNNKLAAGVDHLIYGWVFFGLVIMMMFVIGARWAEPELVHQVASQEHGPMPYRTSERHKMWFVLTCFAFLVSLPHVAEWMIHKNENAAPVSLGGPLPTTSRWQVVSPTTLGFTPAFQNPSTQINQEFEEQGSKVGLYLGYYRNQTYDRKLVSSDNVLVTSNKEAPWIQINNEKREVMFDKQTVSVRSAELRSATLGNISNVARMTVWQIYWINGKLTSSDYVAKVYSALHRLLGRGDESAVIILYAPKALNGDAVLASFVSENASALNAYLLKAATAR